jgi:hypothetical protein
LDHGETYTTLTLTSFKEGYNSARKLIKIAQAN